MPVSDQNAEYRKHLPLWCKVGDCVEGSHAVKAGGAKYLPKPNPEDISEENGLRFKDYVERASFVNFTGSTKVGLTGMVFRKDTVIELPESVEYLEDNANGGGLTLDQMVRDAVGETLEAGRYGVLVDYPQADAGLTAAQVRERNLRANILPYPAKSVINWRTETFGGITKLSLVVLIEPTEFVAEDGFGSECKDYYRVLRLENGLYVQELYSDQGERVSSSEPRKSDGSRWDVIPFVFIGSQNNDATIDKGPLLDIAEINIAHYRNSADFEESSYQVGQPTPVVSGLDQGALDAAGKSGFLLGSRTAWALNVGASADLLQANPNQMPAEGMKEKESQMVKIGAKIITDAKGVETAEAAKINFAGSTSQLGIIVGNVGSAFIQCIEWCLEFMNGAGQEFKLEINREFYDATLDPQMVMAQIQLHDRGLIADEDVRWNLRRGNMISDQRTDEEIDAEAEAAEII
jgi:hypothetical protein